MKLAFLRRVSVSPAQGECSVTSWVHPHPQVSVWLATTASTV